jgi:tetratricopeptide (TPR) repeat protein
MGGSVMVNGYRDPKKLWVLGLTAVSLSLGGMGSAIADGMPGGVPATAPSPSTDAGATAPTPADNYTRAMLIGYAAAEQRDYHTALINFRRALAARPGDRYALAAIANMEAYIAQEREAERRRQRAIDLQATLAVAVEFRDWACAAAAVDELITLVPANSLERASLVAYRGEIAGFLNARDGVDAWSTVCPG